MVWFSRAVGRPPRCCPLLLHPHAPTPACLPACLACSYVLFASDLPCPHIAAGANLSLPLVGRLLRACGAFFIRRTSRGSPDANLYKAVLAGGRTAS